MDAIFSLAPEQRARVLERTAARIPGCLYLFLWAPVIAGQLIRSGHLFCLDAWIGGAGGGRVLAAFEAYRGSLCAVVSGCVPGWAYKDGRAYMELPELDLTASASLQVQQELYHEAGTKMAVFMGCDGGEMEVGLASSTSPAAAAVPDHVHQALLEELMQMTPSGQPPSSSSSSLPSLSIGSPEYSSFIRSMTTTATATEPSSSSSHERHPLQPAVPLPGLLMPPVYGGHVAPFPSSEAEDAVMRQAMLAVIASSSSAPLPLPPAATTAPPQMMAPPWLARHRAQAQRSSPRRRAGAFKAYSAALSPRARRRPGAPAQRMVKTAIALMVSVYMEMRDRELAAARRQEDVVAAPPPPPPQPTSSQLHHMISERRRRERLNESFQTLRALLPPGAKKDKATVLASTTEYMNKLIAEVSELEEKNRRLEAQLGLPGRTRQAASDGSSSETTVQVDVSTGASTSTSTSEQPREVGIRVTVRAECDLAELVMALLARIKEMGRFLVVTVDAEERSRGHAQVSITLRDTAGDDELIDDTSIKEAVAKVVEDTVARPPPPPMP